MHKSKNQLSMTVITMFPNSKNTFWNVFLTSMQILRIKPLFMSFLLLAFLLEAQVNPSHSHSDSAYAILPDSATFRTDTTSLKPKTRKKAIIPLFDSKQSSSLADSISDSTHITRQRLMGDSLQNFLRKQKGFLLYGKYFHKIYI